MRRLCLLPLLAYVTASTTAAPTGADLERACARALRAGFSSDPGLACLWYGTPCACDKAAVGVELPRSCPPPNLNERMRAEVIIEGLSARPELREAPVDEAAAMIFAERFPCTTTPTKPQSPE